MHPLIWIAAATERIASARDGSSASEDTIAEATNAEDHEAEESDDPAGGVLGGLTC